MDYRYGSHTVFQIGYHFVWVTKYRYKEEFPHLKKRYGGRHFWARGYLCAAVGQMTEEMIKRYLEHHFEPKPNDDFRMEPE